MTDAKSPQTSGSALVITPDVQEKFVDLLKLIVDSESMNNEERQYWINILPVMTPEQIKNLEEILTNEKKQLAAIDAKYTANAQPVAQAGRKVEDIDAERKRKREERAKMEKQNTKDDLQSQNSVLDAIDKS